MKAAPRNNYRRGGGVIIKIVRRFAPISMPPIHLYFDATAYMVVSSMTTVPRSD